MLKRIGLSMALLAGLVAFAAPRQAKAETRFGIYVGSGPQVYAPAPAPVYNYDPYAYSNGYYDYPAPVYSYPAPAYVAPYSYGYYSHGWRDHDRHEFREHHEMRERGDHGRRR